MRPVPQLDHLTGEPIVATVFVPRVPSNFIGTIRCLQKIVKLPVVVGVPQPDRLGPLAELDLPVVATWSSATLVNDVWMATRAHILAVSDAALLPAGCLDTALRILDDDLRIGTVSFLSNAAAFLSFPHRNRPVERTVEGHDESTLTQNLRATTPNLGAVPIPMAAGPAVLVSGVALGAVGLLENAESGAFAAALADFSFRGRERGFFDVLDAGTFVARPSDTSIEPPADLVSTGLTPEDNGWLHERHPMAHAFVEAQSTDPWSPLGTALTVARSKAQGLRVLVDGTCLGGQEMGTQATTVATIDALARSSEVSAVGVLLPGPAPRYAEAALAHPKVSAAIARDGDLTVLGRFDIGHRPFQPNEGFDAGHWRTAVDRIVITVHDLISYHVGTYSGTADQWLRYRGLLRSSLPCCDGVLVISEDVRRMFEFERVGVPQDRLFVVPMGTGHLTGDEPARIPPMLAEAGLAASEFLLCLGTNYTHKNRDLALRTHSVLRERGHDLALVMAGASVPWGSSRALEGGFVGDANVVILPDVPSIERNWLLRHAGAVLYPTSAEGFGLVPFEAARFGTPTVHVSFGPLAELLGQMPVLASDWSPESLADAAEALLTDPALAARQVAACLEHAENFTWDASVERLAGVYRSLLARPPAR